MSGRIRILDNTLIDQIAAGEVVERPASVVKELLENALDAEATSIRVELEEGGRSLIRIADDGIGMSPEDAALAVERHATSKLAAFDDLLRVRTLGFRGEALPSIASVSRFELVTRPRAAVAGTRVRVEGGGAKRVESAGAAPGTVIEVRDLFYNVPARRKFLKARQHETRQIIEICLRIALSEPGLRLNVTQDGKTLRSYLPTLGLEGRAQTIFENTSLRSIEAQRGSLTVEAMLGGPEAAQRGARRLFLYVNGRSVSDPKLARAVAFAYGDTIAPGTYPVGVVHLRLDPEDVDVNAHPQKTEVRFTQEREVQEALTRLLAAHLASRPYVRSAAGAAFWAERLHPAPPGISRPAGPLFTPKTEGLPDDRWGLGSALRDAATGPLSPEIAASPAPPEPSMEAPPLLTEAPAADARPVRPPGFFARLRYLGQVRGGYLVCEGERALYLLDAATADLEGLVHAMQEGLAGGAVPSRRLLFPARIELGEEALDRASSAKEALLRFGFDGEPIGRSTLALHRVPVPLRDADPRAALLTVLPLVGLAEGDPACLVGLRALLRPAALEPGTPLDEATARKLLETLDVARGRPESAPSGSPIVRSLALPDP
jgi:DNA mismatch repair protein MutL